MSLLEEQSGLQAVEVPFLILRVHDALNQIIFNSRALNPGDVLCATLGERSACPSWHARIIFTQCS